MAGLFRDKTGSYVIENGQKIPLPEGFPFDLNQQITGPNDPIFQGFPGIRQSVINAAGTFGSTRKQNDEERLRFLRGQLRKGRISTILQPSQSSESGGFQLGKKSLLGA